MESKNLLSNVIRGFQSVVFNSIVAKIWHCALCSNVIKK